MQSQAVRSHSYGVIVNKEHWNPDSPWNPREPVPITPEDFEKQVVEWVAASSDPPIVVETKHQATTYGQGGEYRIDVRLILRVVGQATIVILIECKHQKRPVERDELLVLEGKLRDTGAHKGILFSTSGFQKGAIRYAAARGIATVTLIDRSWLFVTKANVRAPQPPPRLHLPRYAGLRLSPTATGLEMSAILPDRLEPLHEWLCGTGPKAG